MGRDRTMAGQGAGRGRFDAVVVGAGFAGLLALHRLRGLGLTVRVFEAGDGVGGTWYWNRYPGARCDVESLEYSYQFDEELQQEWEWTERFAGQPEILRYLDHVADRFDLRRDIQLATRVETASFDEAANLWRLSTDDGGEHTARWIVMATGCLSSPNMPELPGLDRFEGRVFHTGRWPHEQVDFTGRRVAVIGTGSSAIQSIPLIAQEADRLYVFQRTANYSVPSRNGPLDPEEQQRVKADYVGFRARGAQQFAGLNADANPQPAIEATPEERQRVFEERWAGGGLRFLGAFADLMLNEESNAAAADFIRSRIAELVKDPATAELLTPKQVFGGKRLCVDSGYYETFNRPNVTLVDARTTPIEEIMAHGLRTAKESYEVDDLVLATGFDAMTGTLLRIDIRGRGARPLRAAWAEGPRTYLGLMIAGFPNLFTVSGPGSPSVLSNMAMSIEQHVRFIAEFIGYAEANGVGAVEATASAQESWVEHVNEVASATLYPRANSWYVGANVPGKPRVFMPYIGGFPTYVVKCEDIAANGYEGFLLSKGVGAETQPP
jgi:cation diffusion facilitator CzcD-associated flavoprotein CzcO